MALNTGDTLLNGQYHILRLLGRGGFGFVYHAEDTHLREQVAIKELIPALVGDEATLKRFLAEARATMRLTHRHIVRTYHVFPAAGNDYIVMEYMAGGSLEDRLRRGGCLPVEEAVRMAAQVCEGLACAHEEQVVHCDLKPANILFDAAGRAKIADFGIAHVSGEMLTRSWITPAGFVAGTLPYMSPEQTDGVRDEPRIDLYALGAVLYRALTGRTYLAFDPQETPRAQAQNVGRIYDEQPVAPSTYNGEVPTWLDAVILKALAKRPDDRWPTAEAMHGALRQLPAEVPTRPPTRVIPDRQPRGSTYPPVPAGPPVHSVPRQAAEPAVVPSPAPSAPAETISDGQPRRFTYPPARPTPAPAPSTPVTEPEPAPAPDPFSPDLPVGWLLPDGPPFHPVHARAGSARPAADTAGASAAPGDGSFLARLGSARWGIAVLVLVALVAWWASNVAWHPEPAPVVVATQPPAVAPTDPGTPTPEPAVPAAGTAQTRSTDGMVMVYVPAGEFTMGSSDADLDKVLSGCSDCTRDNFADEQPQHTVDLDGFWIDRTEVSNAQYRICVETGPCRPPSGREWNGRTSHYGDSNYDNHPVAFVDWGQAQVYCRWAGARLPTEAEWEKAARGTDGRVFPWGTEVIDCQRANYWGQNGGCVGDSAEIDSYAEWASPYGALNMVGNVSEWVADWYAADYYAHSESENPQGPEPGQQRVVRGGNMSTGGIDNRTAYRNYAQEPRYQVYYIGFRCAWGSPAE